MICENTQFMYKIISIVIICFSIQYVKEHVLGLSIFSQVFFKNNKTYDLRKFLMMFYLQFFCNNNIFSNLMFYSFSQMICVKFKQY